MLIVAIGCYKSQQCVDFIISLIRDIFMKTVISYCFTFYSPMVPDYKAGLDAT